MNGVVGGGGHNLKVLKTVVVAKPVFMMYMLESLKWPLEAIGHNDAMFAGITRNLGGWMARQPDHHVTISLDVTVCANSHETIVYA